MIHIENLPIDKIKLRCTLAAKKWVKERNYPNLQICCIRGVYHLTNGYLYMLSAKYVLEQATGLEFVALNANMAKLDHKYYNQ